MSKRSVGYISESVVSSLNEFSNRNMVINGAMQVDQRNSGSSYTVVNATYGLDRWGGYSSAASKYSVQRLTTTPPAGFGYYQRVTSLAATADTTGAYYSLYQVIEGFNSTKLAWGTASAKSVSLSFWVRSSLTGTFGGALRNAGSGGFYSYAFTYTINAANTWEYKTISITGSTAGTWGSTNDAGINLFLDLGTNASDTQAAGSWANANKLGANGCVRLIGTNAATLDFTGVQLEAGAVATPFEFEDIGVTLDKCQRYYFLLVSGAAKSFGVGAMITASEVQTHVYFPTTMRTTPTLVAASGTNYYDFVRNGGDDLFNSLTIVQGSSTGACIYNATEISGTAGHAGRLLTDSASGSIAFSAEL